MKNILISGAGIAGCVLAWWLTRGGYKVTVVEKAPSLRAGGYSVDIRGAAVEIIKLMGLHDLIRQKSSDIKTAIFVDDDGKPLLSLPSDVMEMQSEGDLELLRGELLSILFDATKNDCNYLFGRDIRELEETEEGVKAVFTNGESNIFDIVIGADGMHSNVRKIIFGDESLYSYSYGNYYFAFFSSKDFQLGATEIFYPSPNKTINIYTPKTGGRSKVLVIIKDENLNPAENAAEQIKELLSGLKWRTPELIDELAVADDLYVDRIKQIRMPQWFNKNVVLTGDAAYAPSLATGQGTSMAIVGAYVLAREITNAKGNTAIAFPAYQKALGNYVKANQKMGKNVKNMVAKNRKVLNMQFTFLKLVARWSFLANMMKKGMARAANAVNI